MRVSGDEAAAEAEKAHTQGKLIKIFSFVRSI